MTDSSYGMEWNGVTADAPGLRQRLESVEQVFRGFGRGLKERHDRGFIDKRRLAQRYLEGRAWIVCELDLTEGGHQVSAALSCHRIDAEVAPDVSGGITEGCGYAGHMDGGQQQPVLVDVAKLVQDPEGVAITSLVCLHFIDEDALDRHIAWTEASYRPHLTGEAGCIVGEWESNSIALARMWVGQSYSGIIKNASQVPDSVTNESIERLVRLMKRVKENFHDGFPLIGLNADSIKVCRQKESDLSIYVRNVLACAV
ncbi:hypothetical protein IGS68_22575 [Skermanella sp. TT6]|uniref:Uncharacterized protein n=1 Tax=Skermanella cutis TaxID=2775420 RepID=A0ABX7B550_9PROT|nr:hypothetical protein [Skermanella sp. TT6]QQP88770.1 hypothetical protein IGS68_22575 [Skermanella sp. TT6]